MRRRHRIQIEACPADRRLKIHASCEVSFALSAGARTRPGFTSSTSDHRRGVTATSCGRPTRNELPLTPADWRHRRRGRDAARARRHSKTGVNTIASVFSAHRSADSLRPWPSGWSDGQERRNHRSGCCSDCSDYRRGAVLGELDWPHERNRRGTSHSHRADDNALVMGA